MSRAGFATYHIWCATGERVMNFCRLRMVPFVGECPHGGRDDREDNNEIHGNLPTRPGLACGRRG